MYSHDEAGTNSDFIRISFRTVARTGECDLPQYLVSEAETQSSKYGPQSSG